MELLIDADRQRSVFSESCEWAEEIEMCLGWLEGGDTQGPSWDQLEPHLPKLKAAVIGLNSMRSDPYLLRRVYDHGVLRLVDSTEGGFSPNTYVFRRGQTIRALVASAPFSSSSYEQSLEAMVLFEGDQNEPFALQAQDLLRRCKGLAVVPTIANLEEYGEVRRKSLSRLERGLTALSSRVRRYRSTSLEGLEIVTDRETILRGTVSALESLERACSWEGEGDVRVRRDRLGVWVHYVESLGLWGAFVRREERHVCLFGVNPESNNPLPCDLEVTIAPEGIDPKATGVFARRDGDPGLYLVVRGLREGRSVAMPPSLLDMLDGGVSVMRDGAEMRGLVVGNVYSPELPTHVAGLAMELKRFNEVLL